MKKNHRTVSAYAALIFAGLLLLAGITLTGCGSDTSPGEENHDEQAEEGSHDEENVVRLTLAELEEFDIEVLTVGPGAMNVEMTFPGEVRVNQDRYAHVVSRVPGVVRSVLRRERSSDSSAPPSRTYPTSRSRDHEKES